MDEIVASGFGRRSPVKGFGLACGRLRVRHARSIDQIRCSDQAESGSKNSGLLGGFDEFAEFTRVAALHIVVGFHDDDVLAARQGGVVEGIKVVGGGVGTFVHGQNVGGGDIGEGGLMNQVDGLAKTFLGHGHVVGWRRIDGHPFANRPAVGDDKEGGVGLKGVDGVAVLGHEGINVDELFNTVGHAVSHASDNHATVTVSNENDVVQVFPDDVVNEIVDMGVEINVGAGQMVAFAESGQGGAADFVTVGGQDLIHLLPIPAAAPSPRHEHEQRLRRNGRAGDGWGRSILRKGVEAETNQNENEEIFHTTRRYAGRVGGVRKSFYFYAQGERRRVGGMTADSIGKQH